MSGNEPIICTTVTDYLEPVLSGDGTGSLPAITCMQFLKNAADNYGKEVCVHTIVYVSAVLVVIPSSSACSTLQARRCMEVSYMAAVLR